MKIINLTGHQIVIYKGQEKITIAADQGVRLELGTNNTKIGEIEGIPIIQNGYTYNDYLIKAIAPVKKGTIYIVSIVVAQAIQRSDFYIVGTTLKTREGKVIGSHGISPNPFYHSKK